MRTGDSVGAFYVFPYISGKTEPTSDIIRTFVTLNIIRMKTKKKDSFMDYIKANRKGSREAEIENHGHPVSFNRVHVSKKVFKHKKKKGRLRGRFCLICTLSFATISAGGCVPDIFP